MSPYTGQEGTAAALSSVLCPPPRGSPGGMGPEGAIPSPGRPSHVTTSSDKPQGFGGEGAQWGLNLACCAQDSTSHQPLWCQYFTVPRWFEEGYQIPFFSLSLMQASPISLFRERKRDLSIDFSGLVRLCTYTVHTSSWRSSFWLVPACTRQFERFRLIKGHIPTGSVLRFLQLCNMHVLLGPT